MIWNHKRLSNYVTGLKHLSQLSILSIQFCQFFAHHYASKVQQTCLFRPSPPVSSVRTTVATQGAIKNPSHGGRLEAILDWMSCELPPMSPKSFSLLICEIYDQFFWSRSQKQIWSTRGTSSRNVQPRTPN